MSNEFVTACKSRRPNGQRAACLNIRWRNGGYRALLGLLVLVSSRAMAQNAPNPVDGVRLEQRLDASVPLDVQFTDEKGGNVTLADFAHGRPVVLVPVYYRCPMLCTQVLNAMVRSLNRIDLEAGTDFEVVAFTIDPREKPGLAAEKRLHYLRQYKDGHTTRGWHFLTCRKDTIDRVTSAIGYHYVYDPASDLYAHPAAVVLLTPKGKVSRYLLGLDYTPRDMRLALVETGNGTIGTIVDAILLRCFCYDPTKGKYGLAIMNVLRGGGALTVLAVALIVWRPWRRRRRRAAEPVVPAEARS